MRELEMQSLQFLSGKDFFQFSSTEEIESLNQLIGQDRAVHAIDFGLNSKNEKYNIFLSGSVGTGKTTYACIAAHKMAATEPVPTNWCYVNNFNKSNDPIALSVSDVKLFSTMINNILEKLRENILTIFDDEEYKTQIIEMERLLENKQLAATEVFTKWTEDEQGFIASWNANRQNYDYIALHDGVPINNEDITKLPAEEKEKIKDRLFSVRQKYVELVKEFANNSKLYETERDSVDHKHSFKFLDSIFLEIENSFVAEENVLQYLQELKKDMAKTTVRYKKFSEQSNKKNKEDIRENKLDFIANKYEVNVFIDNAELNGAPVIFEKNPTYQNIMGVIEYKNQSGMLSTNHLLIKPGAIHKANGGYLILQARDLLLNPFAWEGLKRVLKSKKITIENMSDKHSGVSIVSLAPQPIPVTIKILLVGNLSTYALLKTQDEDFGKFFKVHACFDDTMDLTKENVQNLLGVISYMVKKQNLLHFNAEAAEKLIKWCSKVAGNQKKMTTRFNKIMEFVYESSFWAKQDGKSIVSKEYVEKALSEKTFRVNISEDKVQEMFANGKMLIDIDGTAIGQINGLAIFGGIDHSFGKPSRITANTYLGKSGIINIERETDMSGNVHSKGVMILSSYISSKYSQDYPLALAASITFEQLYSGVDGDSASSSEIYAILSSIAKVPLKQYIAVTGSVNQKGEIQPIGGATEKIEGFFAVCKESLQGLTGRQGVLIPHQNVQDLILKEEVLSAIANKTFHIYPVATIDQGLEILTDMQAESFDEYGKYTADCIHGRVAKKLYENAEKMKEYR